MHSWPHQLIIGDKAIANTPIESGGTSHGETNSPRAFLVGSISVSGPSGGGADGLLSARSGSDRFGPRRRD
jgi:hypothetical protein